MKEWEGKGKKPFMVINDLSKIFHYKLRRLADESGLNESYRHILFHLVHKDGVTQLELARATNLRPPTISVTLQKMQEEGYVERRRDETDLRSTRVFLTDRGRAFDDASRKLVESIDTAATKGFTEDEITLLMNLLGRIRENVAPDGWCPAKPLRCQQPISKGGNQ